MLLVLCKALGSFSLSSLARSITASGSMVDFLASDGGGSLSPLVPRSSSLPSCASVFSLLTSAFPVVSGTNSKLKSMNLQFQDEFAKLSKRTRFCFRRIWLVTVAARGTATATAAAAAAVTISSFSLFSINFLWFTCIKVKRKKDNGAISITRYLTNETNTCAIRIVLLFCFFYIFLCLFNFFHRGFILLCAFHVGVCSLSILQILFRSWNFINLSRVAAN